MVILRMYNWLLIKSRRKNILGSGSRRILIMSKGLLENRKAAALPENILMMYRLALLAVVALTVLGISSIIYYPDINIRDVEARIMARDVVQCLVDDGMINLSEAKWEEHKYSLLDYCGFLGDVDRYFVKASIVNSGEVIVLQQGDEGAKWVLGLVESTVEVEVSSGADIYTLHSPYAGVDDSIPIIEIREPFEQYKPGYFLKDYDARFVGNSFGKIFVEVLVNADI